MTIKQILQNFIDGSTILCEAAEINLDLNQDNRRILKKILTLIEWAVAVNLIFIAWILWVVLK